MNSAQSIRPVGSQSRGLRIAVTMVVALLTIQGCTSVTTQPQVVEPTAQAPSAQNVEMVRALGELSALKEELKLLRNRLEEIQFNQENADRRQQDTFQDLDRRLTAMESSGQDIIARLESVESGAPVALSGTEGGSGLPGDQTGASGQIGFSGANTGIAPDGGNVVAGTTSDTSQVAPVDTVTVTSTRSTVAGGEGNSGTGSVSLSEQDAYDTAFESLKQSRYQDAIAQFQGLINTWPESELADDALYWMSEANYVNREFEAALNGFRDLVQSYPGSSRVPEAMLKVGYIQYDIGAYDQAAKTFEDILVQFPGHQVTVSAETRLRRIKQTIQ